MMAELRIGPSEYARLHRHLHRPDRDEHGAIILAGVHQGSGKLALLAREIHPLDDADFPPGKYGYRQFSASVLAALGNRANDQGLALVTCHSHPGATTRNNLSSDDLASHRRVFPHLLDIVGAPVGGIAFGTASAAGEIWAPSRDPVRLSGVQVMGAPLRRLQQEPESAAFATEERFDRQIRLFGAAGQQVLRRMRVGVIGVGGGGSMLVEQLAHLGVGTIVVVDFDVVKAHNLSRIVGASSRDARDRTKKVRVASRHVGRIDPNIRVVEVDGDIADHDVATKLTECDFLFLATDTITSRLVANAIVQSHLIPAVQIGAKVDLRRRGDIESIYVAVRPFWPGQGCLDCAGLIDPMALRDEENTDQERAAQNYLDSPEVIDPSVVSLNGMAASAAVNVMLMSAVGLADENLLRHRLLDAQTGDWLALQPIRKDTCLWCGESARSRYGLGDAAALPTRASMPRPRSSSTRAFREWVARFASRRSSRQAGR
jgi:molybdopterin/thiamine biosynthesis adenylyltransferase